MVEQVLGNEGPKQEIEKIIKKKDVHALLMYGPSGCGKTTLAKIAALGLSGGHKADIIEKNIGDQNGINDIRAMIEQSKFLPVGPFKVFILDEVHSLRGPAQSAILKTIEEPEHNRVVWILCTDRPQMLEVPLLNRLHKVGVVKPDQMTLAKHLYKVAQREKAFDFPEKQVKRICEEIALASDRVPREALQLLKSISNKQETFKDFKELVIQGIRRGAEETIDKIALQAIMAFYSPSKSCDERAEFLVNQLYDKDLWALTMRLTDIHHHLMNTIAGIRGGPGYYYKKQLEEHKAIPNLRMATYVAAQLVELRNNLQNVNTKVEHFIVPKLLDIVYGVEERYGKRKSG